MSEQLDGYVRVLDSEIKIIDYALDSINEVPQHQIGSHQGEFKAFANEHDYQIKKGEKLDFKDYDDILVHIKINYK